MMPAENISLMESLFVDRSLILMISGATKPGVPHLTKRYFSSSAWVASPKSQRATSAEFYLLKMMF